MIAKAVIEEQVGNKFKVRIPLFESAGNKNECILTATLSYVPGNLDSYVVGDVVFVAFENNQISNPVIIGKLYLGPEKQNTNLSQASVLNVINEAKLPNQTSIGEFSPAQVYSALKNSEIYEGRVTNLEKQMKSLLDDLTPHPEPPTYELYAHNVAIVTFTIQETYPSYEIYLSEIVTGSADELTPSGLIELIKQRGILAASGYYKTNSSTTYQIHGISRTLNPGQILTKLVAISDSDTTFDLGALPTMSDRVTKIL